MTAERCPFCSSASERHDVEFCRQVDADRRATVAVGKRLGLPGDRVARVFDSIACEVPAPHRLPAAVAAVEAWARSIAAATPEPVPEGQLTLIGGPS